MIDRYIAEILSHKSRNSDHKNITRRLNWWKGEGKRGRHLSNWREPVLMAIPTRVAPLVARQTVILTIASIIAEFIRESLEEISAYPPGIPEPSDQYDAAA